MQTHIAREQNVISPTYNAARPKVRAVIILAQHLEYSIYLRSVIVGVLLVILKIITIKTLVVRPKLHASISRAQLTTTSSFMHFVQERIVIPMTKTIYTLVVRPKLAARVPIVTTIRSPTAINIAGALRVVFKI